MAATATHMDLLSQPSTAELLMGTRVRGSNVLTARDLEGFEDLNFNPDSPTPSLSSTAKVPAGVDGNLWKANGAVDQDELKRRTRGALEAHDENRKPFLENLRTQILALGLKTVSKLITHSREHPRIAAGTVLFFLLALIVLCTSATSGILANNAPDVQSGTGQELMIAVGSNENNGRTVNSGASGNDDDVVVADSITDSLPSKLSNSQSKSGGKGKDTTFKALKDFIQDGNAGLRMEIASLRGEVATLKQLLLTSRSEDSRPLVSAEVQTKDVDSRQDSASTAEQIQQPEEVKSTTVAGAGTGEVRIEKLRGAAVAVVAGSRASSKKALGETRIQKTGGEERTSSNSKTDSMKNVFFR